MAISEYQEGGQWRPRALSPGEALLALLANTASARLRPAASLLALRHVVAQAPVVKGTRGEAEETAAALLEAVSQPTPPTPS